MFLGVRFRQMPNDNSRRTFLKAAGLSGVGVLGSLAGCARGGSGGESGGSGETDGSGGSTTSGSDGGDGGSDEGGSDDLPISLDEYTSADIEWQQFEGTEVNIGAVQHPWVEAIRPAVPVFEELTGIDVVWNILPEQEFRTKRLTDVSTGAGEFDAFYLDQVVNQFRDSGWLQPLDPYFDDDSMFDEEWFETSDLLEASRQQAHGAGLSDTWTGMPITVEVLTTFYRTDLYEKHDLEVPETMAELRENARIIDENEDIAGCCARGQQGYGMNIYIQNSFIREWGEELWDEYPSDSALSNQAAIEAGEFYVNTLQDYGPEGASSQVWSDVLSTMQSGEAGHILADANLFWGGLTDPDASDVADNIGITTMPVPDVEGGRFAPNAFTWQLSTSENADNSEQAFLFMIWACSKPTMNWMYVNQGASFPVRQSTWENDDFVSEVGEEFTSTSLESLQSAIGDPFDPQYPEWGQDYSEELQLAIAGDKSVEEAFTDAAAAAEDIAGQ